MEHKISIDLEKSSDNELFSIINKGNIEDLESIQMAIKILKHRKCDLAKLEEAKNKILDMLDEELYVFTSAEKEYLKKKKDRKSSFIYAFGIMAISSMIYLQNQNGMTLKKQPPLFLYIGVSALFITFSIVQLIKYQKSKESYLKLDFNRKAELKKQIESLGLILILMCSTYFYL